MQSRGPGNTHREVTYLRWAALPYVYACGCVLANADKRHTIFNTYTHPVYTHVYPYTLDEYYPTPGLLISFFFSFLGIIYFITTRE